MTVYKRFLVMKDERYYPSAGTKSISGSFDTFEEALASAITPDPYGDNADFTEIFDCDNRETVWSHRA